MWKRLLLFVVLVGSMLTVTSVASRGTAGAGGLQTFFSQVASFGSAGAGPGQMQSPEGVAVQPTSGNVYVADTGNDRVDVFGPTGSFIEAFGWGVADGQPKAEVCTTNCQTGIAGSGPGQFSKPTTIASGAPPGPAADEVFVGDAGNNAVETFDAAGNFVSTIDGTSTPQGRFQNLVGLAVDRNDNLWTADGTTNNVDEFNASGAFIGQWTDTHGSPSAIAVDAAHDSVYLTVPSPSGCDFVCSGDVTERWTLTGASEGDVELPLAYGSEGFNGPTASAIAVDRSTGDVYVDHNSDPNSDVRVYDPAGTQVDQLLIGPTTANSQGLAFAALRGGSARPGQHDLYVSDATNDDVTVYAPQSTPGVPLVTYESATPSGTTTATLAAGVVPVGNDTTCQFQYVDYADFNATGYAAATTVPCSPRDLGFGFTYEAAKGDIRGLATGNVFHFRVVATNSAGTTTGADQEFKAGPGAWASFSRCPVNKPAMLATKGFNISTGAGTIGLCLSANSTHGSISIGSLTATTGNTNLQIGLVGSPQSGAFTVIPQSARSLVADAVQLATTPVGPVTAVTESAGTPSNFCLFCGISADQPIITIPIKIKLQNPTLGPSCSIGTDQNPILLNPQNTALSNAKSVGAFFSFDSNGVPDSTPGSDGALLVTGLVQGDDTFAVPGATGCGPNGSLDGVVDSVAGVPSPSGSNHLVLDDASSGLAFPENGEGGQAFAQDWHVAFGGYG
jgi:DNA-binding beta-propeller fold protein YncE